MKFSTRSRYGVNAMFELALRYGEGAIPLKDVADKQSISEAYLEQLMIRLRKAGLVDSQRGVQGGYFLSDQPENISLGSIIRVLEGGVSPVDCIEGVGCSRGGTCPGRIVWEKIYDSVNDVIDRITLKDMIEEYTRRSNHG